MNAIPQHVFISYAKEDQSSAYLLASNLQALGVEPWLEDEHLQAGKDWKGQLDRVLSRQLDRVLNQCTSCFVLLSPAYASSKFAHLELQAIERYLSANSHFAVFPVLLPNTMPEAVVTLPEFIKQRHWSHFQDLIQNNQALERLISTSGNTILDEASDETQTIKSYSQPLRTKRTVKLPDIDWVEIPEGDFGYGDQPLRQTFHHSGFFISRYPITNCQYQTFIDAGGYNDEQWWLDLEKPEPKPPTWPQNNRPREMVSWYEAIAFTRWLSVQLGYEISLSTSLQWEKAARGTDGREYPWGNSYVSGDANVYDVSAGKENLEQTCAVGMYPHRASPYQVMDMAGNVWEWGIDEFNSELATRQDSNHKVTHGGSWLDVPEYARCAVTHQDFVGSRDSRIGFRVVCLSTNSRV